MTRPPSPSPAAGRPDSTLSASVAFVLPLLLSLAAGCGAGAYASLPREDALPDLREMKARGVAYARRTTRVPVEFAPGRTIRIALHETGSPDATRVAVLIHGVLSDGRMWRFVAGELAADHAVITVDLPGCGASDAPDPRSLPAGAYGPASLARAVLGALRGRLAGEARPVVVVAHSLGGMVALRMFADEGVAREYADVLSAVRGLALFTPAHVAVGDEPGVFRAIRRTGDLAYDLARVTGVMRERVARDMLGSTPDGVPALREEADRVVEILSDPARRRAVQAMLWSAVPRRGEAGPDWERIRALSRGYARVTVPCLIAWGGEDRTLPASMGHMLRDDLPRARLRVVERATHCLPTERPALCARLVRELDPDAFDRLPAVATMPVDGPGTTAFAGR